MNDADYEPPQDGTDVSGTFDRSVVDGSRLGIPASDTPAGMGPVVLDDYAPTNNEVTSSAP